MALITQSKNVLQQTNENVPVIAELKPKKEIRRSTAPQERENRLYAAKPRRGSSQKEVRFGSSEEDEDDDDGDYDDEEEMGKKKQHQRPIIPNYVTKQDRRYKRRTRTKASALDLSSQSDKRQSMSVTIARRNARERHRVKLVNQGFASLRSRIPDYISGTENDENKKKKLSKVQTLRMALEYIRHLMDMLELRSADTNEWYGNKSDEETWNLASSSPTEYPSACETDYQQSPTKEQYESKAFYDYEGKEMKMVDAVKDELLLEEDEFSMDGECYYDLDKGRKEAEEVAEQKDSSPLPSITESFPKKRLRLFYETSTFLAGPTAFHL